MKSGILALILLICVLWTPHTEALKCYDCSDDAACATTPSNPQDCTTDGFACFVAVADKTVTRGCKKKTECTGDSCISCETDNCNDNIICKACNGGLDCAQKDSTGIKVCDSGVKSCYTQINSDTETIRGCATTEITNSCPTESCLKCETGLCNKDIFPADRVICHQCTNCKDVTANTATPCLNYQKEDKCYTYGTSADDMARGCVSDKDPKCKSSDDKCAVCEKSSCNDVGFERDQKLKCIKCETKTDPDCGKAQTKEPEACTKKIPFTSEDSCFTKRDENGSSRGCLFDEFTKASECSEDNGCTACTTTDGCNKDTAFQCIVCRSDDTPDCWDKADTITSVEECKNQTEPQKCFHRVSDGFAMRGCLYDASLQVQAQCEMKNECTTCSTTKCNNKKSGASAVMVINSSLLIAIVAIKSFF